MIRHTVCMDEVRVLHDLSKEEALLVIVLGAAVGSIDVAEGREARVGTGGSVDCNERVPSPVTILKIQSAGGS